MKREPRDYQQKAHDGVWAELGPKVRSSVLVMPTGTGKTFVAALIAETARKELGLRTLFLCNREILVRQAESTLSAHGLEVAVEMANEKAHKTRVVTSPDVVVATVQTMRAKRMIDHWPKDYFGLIIQDECHHANSASHKAVYRHFSEALHLGITATPGGGKIIGTVYESRCWEYKILDAIKDGWLSPIHMQRIPIAIDLKGLRTTAGDINAGDLSERLSAHIEELADGIKTYAGGRFGVVFTPSVASAMAMASGLNGLGVDSRYVAGEGSKWGLAKAERKAVLKEFSACKFQVIVCCDLLFEGWDCPHVEFVANCRPTYKLYRFQQMAGRGTRPCPELGKEDLLVLDFDWRTHTNSRDLANTADLFSGDEVDEVAARVRKQSNKKMAKGQEVDLQEEIEDAREWFKNHDRIRPMLTGRKLRLVAEPIVYDPIGVSKLIGVKLNRRYDIKTDRAGPASEAQLNMLKRLGCLDHGEISKWGAGKLIDKLKKRRDKGLANPEQISELIRAGAGETTAQVMSAKQAAAWLATNKEMFG